MGAGAGRAYRERCYSGKLTKYTKMTSRLFENSCQGDGAARDGVVF